LFAFAGVSNVSIVQLSLVAIQPRILVGVLVHDCACTSRLTSPMPTSGISVQLARAGGCTCVHAPPPERAHSAQCNRLSLQVRAFLFPAITLLSFGCYCGLRDRNHIRSSNRMLCHESWESGDGVCIKQSPTRSFGTFCPRPSQSLPMAFASVPAVRSYAHATASVHAQACRLCGNRVFAHVVSQRREPCHAFGDADHEVLECCAPLLVALLR
jgi:hypothetical protein